MEKLDQLKKQLEKLGETYKEVVEQATLINEKIDEDLLVEAKKLIKDEHFALKIGGNANERFVLSGSDRVVLKLMPLRHFGLVIKLGDLDHILAVDSGTIYLPINPNIELIKSLEIKIDTKILDEVIEQLIETRNRLRGDELDREPSPANEIIKVSSEKGHAIDKLAS